MLGNSIALIAVAVMLGVEAYKAKERLPRLILTALAVLFALSGALIQQVADLSPKLVVFISGVFAQPSTWFVLAVALFFVLRPFWQSKPDPIPPATLDQLAANGVLADMQRLREKVDALPEPSKGADDQLRIQLDSLAERLNEHRGLLQSLESGQKASEARLEGLLDRDIERLKTLIKSLDEKVARSLYAIRTRDALEEISAEIEADADILYSRLASGEVYDKVAWGKWENVNQHWIGLIRAWVEHGKWYFGDLTTAVLEVPDHKYGGEWTVSDSQFPNAEAVRIFKKFRIIQTQWEAVKDKVQENLYYVAYHGMSDVEVRRGEQAK